MAQFRLPKHLIGLSVEASHLFPNYLETNPNWSGIFYPSGNISVSYNNRFYFHWQGIAGIGLQGYGLVNKGLNDKYTFDFISPHAFLGGQYFIPTKHKFDGFIRGTIGANLTPIQPFEESFQNYSVSVLPNNLFNPYFKISLGITNQFKNKIGNSKNQLIWELGAIYTHQPMAYGYAIFSDENGQTIAAPTGGGFGFFFKLYFPTGKGTVSSKRNKIKRLRNKSERFKKVNQTGKTTRHL